MTWNTLVDVAGLAGQLGRPDLVVVDCRFQLAEPGWGHAEYTKAHIPGAAYASLDRDLSGPTTGRNGRHPLPDPAALCVTLGRLGIGPDVQVVAYDQDNGMFASRLWWLLRWMGHARVAVLDGGFAAWLQQQLPTRTGGETVGPRAFVGTPDGSLVASLDEVAQAASATSADRPRLLDARAPERFRGEVEPLDAAAGHIPGATNHCFKDNVDAHGRFLPPSELRTRLEARLAGTPAARVIAYCGSGVTACHNLLALTHAGLPGGRLYPGSWSEWSADPGRPVATGD